MGVRVLSLKGVSNERPHQIKDIAREVNETQRGHRRKGTSQNREPLDTEKV